MKLALIPPKCFLKYTAETNYQLCLPHLLDEGGDYQYIYDRWSNDPEQFVILDNGVAEGEDYNWDRLMEWALSLGVDEMVVPDVMKKSSESTDASLDFLEGNGPELAMCGVGRMWVLQGETIEELMDSAAIAANHALVTSIGIPRHLIHTLGFANARYEMAHYLNKITPKPVHLLGGSPYAADEIRRHTWPGNVRGTDTSAPFNYAYKGFKWEVPSNLYRTVARPADYFDLERDLWSEEIVEMNIEYLKSWAGAK